MPQPRKPTEVLQLRGTFKHNPKRTRDVGPKSAKDVGQPPPYLTEDERACWFEGIENAPAGVLTSGDRWHLEMVSRLMAKFRRDWLTGAEMSQLGQALSKLGWTPADRSRVTATQKEEKEDPFAEFLQ